MSQSRPVLKIAVVSVFVVLMSGFVAYRSGAFDHYLDNTAIALPGEAGKTDSPAVDSPKQADMIMPSSKSGKVIEPRPVQNAAPQKDTATKKQANTNKNQDVAPLVIPSSKSGPVFVPKSETPVVIDPIVIPSSKSGPVFVPKTDTSKKKPR
ncbi:MAG: hypothetical protein FD123_1381 [Bacteroidetes bacterium]|nr:MAG: hypothetical protein FD123_1381 [Bacteroidota bacterium]